MGASARERDIERAWRIHAPERAGVPAEARRAVRSFKAAIAPDGAKVKTALRGADPLVSSWAKKGALDRGRKLLKIKAALAPAAVDDAGGALLVLWLEARGQMVLVDHPSFQQDCVIAIGAVASRLRGSVRWSSFPAIEVPDHALARMYQRAPGINASAAMYEAAVAFLRADRNIVEAARLRGESLCLRAGSGLLLCQIISGLDLADKMRVVARANTWIAAEAAGGDQLPLPPALDPARTVLAMVAR